LHDLVHRLSQLDSCAVSDALDRSKISGVVLGLSQLSTTKRIVGEAVTVKLGPDDGRGGRRHLCTAAVEAAGPGKIIVIAHHGRLDAAGWGGILSLAATVRKVEGVVIDGACRDLDESREFGLPVYGRVAVPITARGRVIEYEWNVPVDLSGTRVAPGDLVIADASGVAIIPAEHAAEIIASAEAIAQKERLMAADVRAGKQVSAVMGTSYETMLREPK
jgi:regulator of RNase E activity RraA